MSTMVVEKPKVRSGGGTGLGGSQVVLYNDDHNAFEYVIGCLMMVFGHSQAMATKITKEAHEKGRAIAEVEDQDKAEAHAGMLKGMGLGAEVEAF